MKKLSFMIMAFVMVVMTSCAGGGSIDVKKCNELAQKDVEALTESDVEFLVGQLELAVDKLSASPEAQMDFESEESDVYLNAVGMLMCYSEAKGSLPSDVQKRFDAVQKKVQKIVEQEQQKSMQDYE